MARGRRVDADQSTRSSKINKQARSAGLELTHADNNPMDEMFATAFTNITKHAKENDLLDNPKVAERAAAYTNVVLDWARATHMTLPIGNAPAYTCLGSQATANLITLLQKGLEAGNHLWGGAGAASMSSEDRALIAESFIFSDGEACSMYFKEGKISDEKGVKRTIAALLTYRSADFPMLASMAATQGVHAANESARSNINHVCYPVLVALVKHYSTTEEVYNAANFVIGQSESAIARVLPRACEDAYNKISKSLNVIKMKDNLDARMIPNYCITRKKFEVAVRLAATHKKSVLICNLDELGYTSDVPLACEILWQIYKKHEDKLDFSEVFGFAQVAKRLINGVQMIPVLSLMGGMKTQLGFDADWGWFLQPDGTTVVAMPHNRYDLVARQYDVVSKKDKEPPTKTPSRDPSKDRRSEEKDTGDWKSAPAPGPKKDKPKAAERDSRPKEKKPTESKSRSTSEVRKEKEVADELKSQAKQPTGPPKKK